MKNQIKHCLFSKQRINRYFMVAFFMMAFCLGRSQEPGIARLDSIYRSCMQAPDHDCLDQINSACNALYGNHRDTVIFYTYEQIRLARLIGDRNIEARGYNMLGICTELNGQLDSAITLYQAALRIGEGIDDKKLIIDAANNLGIVYSSKGLFESSIEYTLKGLDMAEQTDDARRQAMLLNNLGLRYSQLRDEEEAIRYFKRAVGINSSNGLESRLTPNYNNLGVAYSALEQQDSALVYWEKGLLSARRHDQKYNMIIAYNGLSMTHLRKGDYAVAIAYNDSAMVKSQQIGDRYGVEEAKMTRGAIYKEQGRFSEAIPLLEQALEYFEGIRYINVAQDIRAALADCYAGVNRYLDAFRSMRTYAYQKDTIYSDQRDKAFEQIALFREQKQEQEKALLNTELELRNRDVKLQKSIRNASIAIGLLMLILAIAFARSFMVERKVKNALRDKNRIIEEEKARSDELLLNILPASVADELKQKGVSEARDFDQVTVLFTDFVEFAKTTHAFTAKGLVDELNVCFRAFDAIMEKYGVEKIKTIGDAYMAAGGLHTPRTSEPGDVVRAGLEMQAFMDRRKKEREAEGLPAFEMRLGIHTGPVVAGIVGVKKFQYDIWGDTVNTASRMESYGGIGKVNISDSTYAVIRDLDEFSFEPRGSIEVKGIGEVEMWYVKKAN